MWLCCSAGISSIPQRHAHCCLPASCWHGMAVGCVMCTSWAPLQGSFLIRSVQQATIPCRDHTLADQVQDMPAVQDWCAKASLACLQQIYVDGLFHPTGTSSMASPLYQNNFSTSAILQQPASIKANLTCTCGQFYDNPCRVEMRTVRDGISESPLQFALLSCRCYVCPEALHHLNSVRRFVIEAAICFILPDSRLKHC